MLLIGYSLAISIPTIIDRSLSLYLLEKVYLTNNKMSLDKFKQIFITDYISDKLIIEMRLTEQQELGNLYIDDGNVILTNQGINIAKFGLFFRKNLLPRKRLVSDRYSEELINY